MSDDYPDHLNPFKQRRSGIRASFRALKNTIGGRFRKKKDGHREETPSNPGVTNYTTTLRNGTVNGTVRSQTTSEIFPRSRINDRVARSHTLQFNGVANGDTGETNPFNETDTTRTAHALVPGKIDSNGDTDKTRRRRRKKRAPLPPGARNQLGVPGEHNTSQWSIDSYTSYETDYSSAAYTQSENELDVPTDLERLKDIQEISKEIQVFCDDNVQASASTVDTPGDIDNAKDESIQLAPPEIEVTLHEEVTANCDIVPNTEKGSKIADSSRNEGDATVAQTPSIEINNNSNSVDNNVEINADNAPADDNKVEITENVAVTNQNVEETKENCLETKQSIETNNLEEETIEIKTVTNRNTTETIEIKTVTCGNTTESNEIIKETMQIESELKEIPLESNEMELETKEIKPETKELSDNNIPVDGNNLKPNQNEDTLKENEVAVCDKQNGVLPACHDNVDNIEELNNATNDVDYVNRKSLYITGSTDNLDVVQYSEAALFITGSCDELDATINGTPRPKVRKSKLSREALLGSNEKVNNSSEN